MPKRKNKSNDHIEGSLKSKDTLSGLLKLDEEEISNTLPTFVCNNPRKLILPEKVRVKFSDKGPLELSQSSHRSTSTVAKIPRHPLHITWSPDCLCFEIDKDEIINRLWIWNLCPRTIYLQVCGFWNSAARLGASWIFKPKTRFRLASGLKAEVCVKGTPKTESPIPVAYMAMQLAVAHVRDNVVGYFVVPVRIKFDNCKQLAIAGEG